MPIDAAMRANGNPWENRNSMTRRDCGDISDLMRLYIRAIVSSSGQSSPSYSSFSMK